MNDIEQETTGRTVSIMAYGDTMADLEMNALDLARAFFGDGPRLRISPNYAAGYDASKPKGQRSWARILVRELA